MATDLRAADLKNPLDIGEYLFRRLHEVGIRSVHGVPGDYNLVSFGCSIHFFLELWILTIPGRSGLYPRGWPELGRQLQRIERRIRRRWLRSGQRHLGRRDDLWCW